MGFKHNNGILECVTDEKYLRSAAGEIWGFKKRKCFWEMTVRAVQMGWKNLIALKTRNPIF